VVDLRARHLGLPPEIDVRTIGRVALVDVRDHDRESPGNTPSGFVWSAATLRFVKNTPLATARQPLTPEKPASLPELLSAPPRIRNVTTPRFV
jgi:hypothetical protein